MPALLSAMHLLVPRKAEEGALGDLSTGVAANRREIVGVSVFSIILATVPVFGRLFFRRASKLPWMADDYLIMVAAVLAAADASLYLACLRHGFGRHMDSLSPATLLSFFKLVWATFLLYGAAVSFVKFSVLAFYYRIFPRSFPKTLITLGVISALWWILFTLITVFQCIPISKNWDDSVEGACLNYLNVYIAIQVLNILLDTAILVLPISAVVKLQMAKANKISVAGTFALGGLAVIFAIIRLYVLIDNRSQTDITFEIATASWSLVEPCFEIFCACLPCMTPLLKAGRILVAKISTLGSSFRTSGLSSSSSFSRAQLKPPGNGNGPCICGANNTPGNGIPSLPGSQNGAISVATSWKQEKTGGADGSSTGSQQQRQHKSQNHFMIAQTGGQILVNGYPVMANTSGVRGMKSIPIIVDRSV